MTVLSDVSLPQINVLGTTMAYREAGDREAPVALFSTRGTRPRRTYGGMSCHWLLRWRIVSRRILSGSANRANPTASIVLPIMLRYLDVFLDQAGISSAFVIAQDWGKLRWHFIWQPAGPEFIRALCLHGVHPAPSYMG